MANVTVANGVELYAGRINPDTLLAKPNLQQPFFLGGPGHEQTTEP